jgi:hypothetical protein
VRVEVGTLAFTREAPITGVTAAAAARTPNEQLKPLFPE